MAIDLRSDTVTRPTPGMRRVIADAAVGDDHLDGDPTTRRLEERIAELLGKDAALFFPSGTMANQCAIAVHTRPATELLVDRDAHVVHREMAGAAANSGVQLRLIESTTRTVTADDLRRAFRPPSRYAPPPSLIIVENTHNGAGGVVTPIDELRAIAAVARERMVPIHLDGARLWNAAAATGTPLADFAACGDTVMVSFSKGLGAPVGSALAGPRSVIETAWMTRMRLGGALRQSGVLAAAALYGIEHHRERLAEDHAHAAALARAVDGVGEARVVPPDTNIVMIDLVDARAEAVARAAARRGVLVSVWTPTRLRAVTHLDITAAHVTSAAEVLADILAATARRAKRLVSSASPVAPELDEADSRPTRLVSDRP